MDLDEALDTIQVMPPGFWESETGPQDWYAVSDDSGIIAYFGDESQACNFRLHLIAEMTCPLFDKKKRK